ncbi:hypothetical protein DPV78_003262 [Talaromyces pinophilus]|nr:hypothetical protein DPV78_003262 [Talaromyces pinophilus]
MLGGSHEVEGIQSQARSPVRTDKNSQGWYKFPAKTIAVIESRSATELGQNIRLLTYVSIVYLPLSVCAAAWNVDYSYHTANFVVVTVLLSTTIYLAVMNLNNVARLGKGLYQRYRNDVVKSMMKDKEWASMGEKSSPERENDVPSERHIVVFAVSQLWKRVIYYLLELQKKILKLMLKKPTQDVENNAALGRTPA